jgi:hypothetical protein
MEMQYFHCYTTVTAMLLWKCNMVHRSCYQGKPDMSQYLCIYAQLLQLSSVPSACITSSNCLLVCHASQPQIREDLTGSEMLVTERVKKQKRKIIILQF